MRSIKNNKLFEDIFDDVELEELTGGNEVDDDSLYEMLFVFKPKVSAMKCRQTVHKIPFDEIFRKFVYVVGMIDFINIDNVEFHVECGKYGKDFYSNENDRTISEFVTSIIDIDHANAKYPTVHESEPVMVYRVVFIISNKDFNERIYVKDMKMLGKWFEYALQQYNSISANNNCPLNMAFGKDEIDYSVVHDENSIFEEFYSDVFNLLKI